MTNTKYWYPLPPDEVRAKLQAAIVGAVDFLEAREVSEKSLSSAVKKFRTSLRAITRSFFDGSATRKLFEQSIKDDIRVDAEFVFHEGMKEGGADPADMTDKEQAYLDAWIDNQLQYVGGLADGAAEAKSDKKTQKAFFDRVDLWVDSMQTLGDTARAFAQSDQMGQWKLGATEEHCATCSRLANGKPHRLSWYLQRGYIPRENGSATLDCHGFRCDCRIDGVKSGERLL